VILEVDLIETADITSLVLANSRFIFVITKPFIASIAKDTAYSTSDSKWKNYKLSQSSLWLSLAYSGGLFPKKKIQWLASLKGN
jgi:hypothetical protein